MTQNPSKMKLRNLNIYVLILKLSNLEILVRSNRISDSDDEDKVCTFENVGGISIHSPVLQSENTSICTVPNSKRCEQYSRFSNKINPEIPKMNPNNFAQICSDSKSLQGEQIASLKKTSETKNFPFHNHSQRAMNEAIENDPLKNSSDPMWGSYSYSENSGYLILAKESQKLRNKNFTTDLKQSSEKRNKIGSSSSTNKNEELKINQIDSVSTNSTTTYQSNHVVNEILQIIKKAEEKNNDVLKKVGLGSDTKNDKDQYNVGETQYALSPQTIQNDSALVADSIISYQKREISCNSLNKYETKINNSGKILKEKQTKCSAGLKNRYAEYIEQEKLLTKIIQHHEEGQKNEIFLQNPKYNNG
ncbi:hypothetical protein EDEG_02062 [Edhazardia aedis USNM 41457]|uniref:Uncharacterized protein n=1 Tax=Edhazardia aedis (strain USNM 41457) TaxID=1003232 RepID=J9DQM3_EDHAE|nr:hypothetical protein EDEG_02062 [Edhazardia aedis USNM 41457]|eukprot:EJW03612.1 hypothetical protein EDEG_02062 [Edhazardia aedis USNM 41457]